MNTPLTPEERQRLLAHLTKKTPEQEGADAMRALLGDITAREAGILPARWQAGRKDNDRD